MTEYRIRESTKKTKKFDMITPQGKVISFGAKGMSDYTINKDPKRRERYINRHANEEKFWDDH